MNNVALRQTGKLDDALKTLDTCQALSEQLSPSQRPPIVATRSFLSATSGKVKPEASNNPLAIATSQLQALSV